MRPSFPAVTTLALAAILLAGCGETGGEAAPAPPVAEPSSQPAPGTVPGLQDVDLAHLGFNEGDMDAAVIRVVEFSDFGCIHCARFHMNDYHHIHDEFIAEGDVVWKYVPITIGGFPNGESAALAGECAGAQDRFAPMRDLLFEKREEWMGETDDPEGRFRGYAREVGLDVSAFDACMHGEEAIGRLAEANQLAVSIGVRGTPTFIVQGFPVQGAPPLDAFQEALREMIAEARAASPGG
jgi:protein-disulfide isomerase